MQRPVTVIVNRRHTEEDDTPQDQVERSGHVRFDERGNAVWDARGARIEHPALELSEELAPHAGLKMNRNGLNVGYDPYRSGAHAKEAWRKKKDLRALSKWIQLKKTMALRSEDESPEE
jgi:hypothetical protein